MSTPFPVHRKRPSSSAKGSSRHAAEATAPQDLQSYTLANSGYWITWDGVTFTFNYDSVLWSISASDYAPVAVGASAPTLTVTINQGYNSFEVKVVLSGARFPGTQIMGDCTFDSQSSFDPIMNKSTNSLSLSWPAMGLAYNGSVYNYPPDGFVRGTIALPDLTFCPLGSAGSIAAVSGTTANVAFKPGVLQISGTGVVDVTGLGADLQADTLQLTTMDGGNLPFSYNLPTLASRLDIGSGAPWNLPAPPSTTPLGTLTMTSSLFDTMDVGTGEDDSGASVQDLNLSCKSTDQQFTFGLGPGVAASFGPAPILALSQCVMIYHFTADTPLASLRAHAIPVNPFWAVRDGVAFHFPMAGQSDSSLNVVFAAEQANDSYCSLFSDRFSLSLDLCWLQPVPNTIYFGLSVYIGNYTAMVIGEPAAGPSVQILNATISLVRPADLMLVQLEYANVVLQGFPGAEPQLLAFEGAGSPRLIVTLPPQHIAESKSTASAPIPARMAGPSRLAFSLPSDVSIPVDPISLLDWTSFDPVVVGKDPFPNPATPGNPGWYQTSIELPYRLLISPGVNAGWSHTPPPASDSGPVGLWFTRLAARVGTPPHLDERDTPSNRISRSMAAVWSPDWHNNFEDPIGSSLTAAQRSSFVDNFSLQNNIGPALDVNHCMLSALGAWADMSVSWDGSPIASSISAWHHVTAQGRDQYVRVATKGYLFPWGHRASWVTVVERTFSGDADNTARLTETDYVVVTERLHDYGSLSGTQNGGRDLPFTAIEVLTTTLSGLDSQTSSLISSDGDSTGAFWVQSGGAKLNLQMRGFDRETSADPRGRAIHFAAPAVFVGIGGSAPAAQARRQEDAAIRPSPDDISPADVLDSYIDAAQTAYDSFANTAPVPFAGQAVAYAETAVAGATSHATQEMTLLTGDARAGRSWIEDATGAAAFYPALQQAMVSLPAVQQFADLTQAQQLAGMTASSVAITLAQHYVQGGFDSTAGEVYAALQTPLDLAFAGPRSNGMVVPNMSVSAISRQFGALPGVAGNIDDLAAGKLNPCDFLDLSATLLGMISLKTLLRDADFIDMAQSAANQLPVPGFCSTVNESEMTLAFHWTSSNLQSIVPLKFSGDGNVGTLDLHMEIVAPIVPPLGTPTEPTATTTANISAFDLSLADLICLSFSALSFVSVKGQKPKVDISLTGVTLESDICFLEPLMKAAQTLFGDAPSLDMLPNSIEIDYSATLPSIDLGVLSLENVRLNSSTTLSLVNDPVSLSFGFSDRTHPFTLAVELLGGGGWFNISVIGDAINVIDFGLQAGATASLDLGIASGSVSIMFGVAFFFQAGGENKITGYVRATGQLTVLQLISIHAEFYLGLTYLIEEEKIWGEADLSVEISIAFFSKTVTLTLRKEFPVKIRVPFALAGHQGVQAVTSPLDDAAVTVPRIIDVMPNPSYWQEYAAAFAA